MNLSYLVLATISKDTISLPSKNHMPKDKTFMLFEIEYYYI